MSEQIKTTTLDQLPEATNLDSLYVFGYASKNTVGNRSVKVPIALLKGNKGDTGMAGVDGKDGDVTTEQLNEALRSNDFLVTQEANGLMSASDKKQLNEIIENMKPNDQKYDGKLICLVKTKTEDLGKLINLTTLTPLSETNLEIKVVSNGINYDSENTTKLTAPFRPTSLEQVVEVYFKGKLQQLNVSDAVNSYMIVSKDNIGCLQVNLWYSKVSSIDFSHMSGFTNISGEYSLIEEIKLNKGKGMTSISVNNSSKLTTLSIIGQVADTITTISANNCPLLKTFEFSNLKALVTFNAVGTLIDETTLNTLESKWASRVGKQRGLLKISRALYDTLATETKNKFLAKDIDIQFL